MFNRLAAIAATGLLAAACATTAPEPAPAAAPSVPAVARTPAAAAAPGAANELNVAATSRWIAEERLLPEDPILALVAVGTMDANATLGVSATCNAANGKVSLHVGKQAADRVGQTATFRLRTGAGVRDLEGKFAASRAGAEFVAPIQPGDLLAMGQLDMVSIVTDKSIVQWALVKDANAPVQASYVGSLKDFSGAARSFLTFCNPK